MSKTTNSISVSGPPGVGKSTLGRLLADHYNMEWIDGGDAVKILAKDLGYNPAGDDWWDTPNGMEFLKMRDNDDSFDKKVDEIMVERYGVGGMVCSSYTIPWLAEGGCRIWLECGAEVIADRIRARDGVKSTDAYDIAVSRYEKNAALYKKIYGFEYRYDESVFTAKIDTDSLSVNEVLSEAKSVVNSARLIE